MSPQIFENETSLFSLQIYHSDGYNHCSKVYRVVIAMVTLTDLVLHDGIDGETAEHISYYVILKIRTLFECYALLLFSTMSIKVASRFKSIIDLCIFPSYPKNVPQTSTNLSHVPKI